MSAYQREPHLKGHIMSSHTSSAHYAALTGNVGKQHFGTVPDDQKPKLVTPKRNGVATHGVDSTHKIFTGAPLPPGQDPATVVKPITGKARRRDPQG